MNNTLRIFLNCLFTQLLYTVGLLVVIYITSCVQYVVTGQNIISFWDAFLIAQVLFMAAMIYEEFFSDGIDIEFIERK